MLSELLSKQRANINYYFEELDLAAVDQMVQTCLNTQGFLVLTGVGKSGIVAEKVAATLVSTGTKALYLPPTNFLHGDIGILSDKDLLILISRSGETEELLNLIPFARKRGTSLAALVSNPSCRLAKLCDVHICLPFQEELCPFDLAPTTSTEVQLLFGDLLTIALMRSKGFALDTYAQNHPLGAIGKKISVTVSDLMYKGEQIPLAKPQDRLIEVLVELSNKKCGALLIADADQRLLGIFTDGDLRRTLQTRGSDVLSCPMQDLMTSSAITIEQDALAWDALKVMQRDPKRFVMVLPVLSEGKIAGILHMHSIIQAGIG